MTKEKNQRLQERNRILESANSSKTLVITQLEGRISKMLKEKGKLAES